MLLDHGWRLQVADLTYAPLGFGSHHWVATTHSGHGGSSRWTTFATSPAARARRCAR